MCGALRIYFSLTRGLIKRKLHESCCSYIFKLTRYNLTKSRIGQILVKLLNLKYPPETQTYRHLNRHQNGKINGSFFKSPNTFLGFMIFLY